MPICVNCGKNYLRGSKHCSQCRLKPLSQGSFKKIVKKEEIIVMSFKEKILKIKEKVDIINNEDFKMLENINQKNLIKFCNVIKTKLGKSIEISKVIAHKEDGNLLKGRIGFIITEDEIVTFDGKKNNIVADFSLMDEMPEMNITGSNPGVRFGTLLISYKGEKYSGNIIGGELSQLIYELIKILYNRDNE
ncbi:hypothetical protein [Clostridium lacusfryxellense]|uniref:hypothetical protein n=1 Tax=Clostridium lacusfryxellense TaxID=205328 RepID=UPI001C0D692E|nr:hypothetical protein [Clostridium lacusfryxellense]MBU3110184.1 hypothetical protein [Clostridium lacusfryxellense]